MEMITGYGVPYKTTQAEPGQYYKDLNTNDVYKCVSKHTVSGTAVRDNGTCEYVWDLVFADPSNSKLNAYIDPEVFNQFYEPLRFPKKIELKYPNVDLSGSGLTMAVYGGGIWFAADGNNVYTSEDGIAWEKQTVSVSLGYVGRLYANGVWVNTVGNNILYYSTDRCKTWTKCTIDTTSAMNEIRHCNGHWYARCASQSATYHSTDGKVWEKLSLPAVSGTYVYANGVYMVSDIVTNKTWKSTDGVNFTEVTSFPSGMAYSKFMYYFNGIWLACDGRSKLMSYSMDNGNTWVLLEGSPVYNMVVQFGSRLVGVNYTTGKTYVSDDGLVWVELEGLSSKSVGNIYVCGNVCIAYTSGSEFYYSLDLDNWYEGNIPDGGTNLGVMAPGMNMMLFRVRTPDKVNKLMYAKMF